MNKKISLALIVLLISFFSPSLTLAATVSATFQNGVNGYSGGIDNEISSDNPTIVYAAGGSNYSDREAVRFCGSKCNNILLRFTNLGIDPDAIITSASLSLKESGQQGSGGLLYASKITQPLWQDTSVTWNSYKTGSSWGAGGGDSTQVTSSAVPGTESTVTFNLGGNFTLQELQQNGILISTDQPGWNYIWFYANESGSVSNRPQLNITYTTNNPVPPPAPVPPPTPSPAPTPTPTPAATPPPSPVPASGVCGSSNGMTVASAPSTNLCSVGTASTITGTGPWSWSCAGTNGGGTVSCSAQKSTATTNITPVANGLKIDLSYVNQSSAAFIRLKSVVDAALAGSPDYGFEPQHAAMMYKITGDQKYCDFAVTYAESCPNGYEHNYGISCGVQAAEADIAAGRSPYVASDSYLESGDIIGSLAITYDWCGSRMTAAQKTRWQNYANQTIYNIWHPDQATWGGRSYPWSGWSITNPGNNYYYSFLEATMYWALASHDTNLLSFVRNQKLQPLVDYYAQIPGGGSLEGTGYGTSHMRLFELYQVWKDSTGEDLANVSTHLADTIHLWLHQTTPNRAYYAPVGDLARSSFPDLFDYHRRLILVARQLSVGTGIQDIASWWLNHISVTQMSRRIDAQWDMLPSGTNMATAPSEPLVYRATGIGRIFARTGWDTSALWMTFAAGKFNESHAHQDQGSFDLADSAWLAVSNNIFSASGINQTTDYHNVLRFVKNGANIPQQEGTESTMTVNQTSANGDIDVTGNITPAYGGNAAIQNWTRNVKFANRKLIVSDNFSVASGVTAVFQIDTPVQPVVSGNTITAGALNIRVDSPANPTITVVNQERYRIDISGGTSGYIVQLSDQAISGSAPISPTPAPVPPPTPTPTPTPPPASTKFTLNDRIQVSSGPLNVRATANTTGTLLGTQATGVLGTVTGGPTNQGGYNWWQVNFDTGVDGYAAEDFMVKYVAPVTPPTPPPTTPPAVPPPTPPAPALAPISPPSSGGGGGGGAQPSPTPPAPSLAPSSGGGGGGGGAYIPPSSSGGSGSIGGSGGTLSTPLFTHDLALGSTDSEVRYLQQFLNTHGVPVTPTGPGSMGNESTIFGPATKNALMTFQDKYITNLPVSERGMVGSVTRARFNTLLAAGVQGSTSSPVSTTTQVIATGTSTKAVLTVRLAFGSMHNEVKLLQQFLIAQGLLSTDAATGYFGKLTQAALQKYQCAKSIVCVGTPVSTGYGATGPKTRGVMRG